MPRFDPVLSRPAVSARAGCRPFGRPAACPPGRTAAVRRGRGTTLKRLRSGRR